MLQPDAAQPVGDRQQEVVVVVVARAVQAVGLIDQFAVQCDVRVGGGQHVGVVGDDVQAHRRAAARIEVDLAIVGAGEDRAVGEMLERDRGEDRHAVLERGRCPAPCRTASRRAGAGSAGR